MPKFQMAETIHSEKVTTVRLGAGILAAERCTDADVGKVVTLAGESRYDVAADGAAIQGFVSSVEVMTYDGYSVGGLIATGTKSVTFSGSVVIGDLVVAAAQPARQAKLNGPAPVKKAADQAVAAAAPFKWRVVSLGAVGTGAAGTTGLIERI